jgi:LacI family transcriptional regulator
VSTLLTPRLTTVRQPAVDMGCRAVSALFDLLANRKSDATGLLPVTVQLRDSVCPPGAPG